MAKERKKKIGRSGELSLDGGAALSVSIGQALGLTPGKTRENPRAPEDTATAPPDAETGLAAAAQATLHRETSGRGGRVVTAVSLKPAPDARTAERIAHAMRKGLGCGSRVEGAKIILQGDIRDRAGDWLARRGVKKIVMGN